MHITLLSSPDWSLYRPFSHITPKSTSRLGARKRRKRPSKSLRRKLGRRVSSSSSICRIWRQWRLPQRSSTGVCIWKPHSSYVTFFFFEKNSKEKELHVLFNNAYVIYPCYKDEVLTHGFQRCHGASHRASDSTGLWSSVWDQRRRCAFPEFLQHLHNLTLS